MSDPLLPAVNGWFALIHNENESAVCHLEDWTPASGMLALMPPHYRRYVLASFVLAVFMRSANSQAVEPLRMHVNGIDLGYIERGRGSPVVLLHGGIGDYSSWQPQLELFARRFRVISYSRRFSFPNNNPSIPPHYSPWTDVEDLTALILELGLHDVRIVGQSSGAFVALAFALKHGDMVHSLVLSEPPAHQLIRDRADGEAVYQNFMAMVMTPVADSFRKHDVQHAMAIFVNGMGAANRFDTLSPQARAGVMRNARAIEALALSTDPFPALDKKAIRRLRVPTLVVTGENTIEIHKLVDQELIRLLPDCKSVTVAQSGHSSPRENSPAFNKAVLAFLE
jgi:pimeloyl-ACP methyl ester carboxylesterase